MVIRFSTALLLAALCAGGSMGVILGGVSGTDAHAQAAAANHYPLLDLAQSQAQSQAQTGPDYAFEMRYKDDHVDAHAFVNPLRPLGERVTVTRPARPQWSNDFRETVEAFDAAPLDEFWCSDFLDLIGPDVHPVLENGNTVIFAFTPKPSLDDDAIDRKFLSNMIAHLTLDRRTGAIHTFQMRNRKPFKPLFIAKVKSFQLEARCEPSPDGRRYAAQLSTDLSGTIALKKIKQSERRIITNLTTPHYTNE